MKNLVLLLMVLPIFASSQNTATKIADTAAGNAKVDVMKAYIDSAEYLMQQGQLEEAVNLYKKASEIQPDNDDVYIGWFRACVGSERVEDADAMEAIDKWIENNPDNTQAWLYKGFAEAHLKHPEEALKAFDMLIQLQPEEESNYVGRGQMLYELERYEEAIQAFDKSASMDSSRTDVMGMKVAALAKLGRYDEALFLINKSLEQSPSDLSCIYNRACLYSLKGDKGNALADLKKAIEIDPSIKEYARLDPDFSSLFDDADFNSLTK